MNADAETCVRVLGLLIKPLITTVTDALFQPTLHFHAPQHMLLACTYMLAPVCPSVRCTGGSVKNG